MLNRSFTLILLVIIPLSVYAQLRTGTVEIYMWTSGFSPTAEVDFFLDACGPMWDEDQDLTTVDTLLHSTLNIPEQFNGWTMSHGDDYDNGWDFVTSQSSPETPKYGWGLYEVSTSAGNEYFYIDFRDDRWPGYSAPVEGHSTDIYFRYNNGDDEFEYSSNGSSGWTTISNGEYLELWEIKDKGDPTVGDFENYWTNSLGITVASDSHPRIVWGPHPSFSPISGYKIYWELTDEYDPEPDPGDFSLKATVNSSTLSYYDADVRQYGSDKAWYFVKAYYEHPKTHNITYSSATNTVYLNEVELYKAIGEQRSIVSKHAAKLHQNYPNPFNPTTTISLIKRFGPEL